MSVINSCGVGVVELSDEDRVMRLNALLMNTSTGIKKLEEYCVGELTVVKKLRRVKTKYGDAIIMDSENYSTFLPKKVCQLSESELAGLNAMKNLFMMYRGCRNKIHSITFQIGEIMAYYTPLTENFNVDIPEGPGFYVENVQL